MNLVIWLPGLLLLGLAVLAALFAFVWVCERV